MRSALRCTRSRRTGHPLRGTRRIGDVAEIARGLVQVRTIRTSASETTDSRLREIAAALRQLRADYPIMHMVIELPNFVGTYHRNRGAVGRDGMAAGMSKLYLAAGTIFGVGLGIADHVRFVQAPRVAKPQRQMLAAQIFKVSPAARAHAKRLPSVDALDAVWLGAQQLDMLAAELSA